MKPVLKNLICMLVLSFFLPRLSWAYRPFESTEAEIEEKRQTELEWGFFRYENEGTTDRVISPDFQLDYGIADQWELTGQGRLQIYDEEGRNLEILEPEIFVKRLIREGSMQDKTGPSLAAEFGPQLPSTKENERSFGLHALGISSYEFAGIMNHLNLGLEQDREDFKSNFIWGTILEYPSKGKYRLVSEFNGRAIYSHAPENSALIGAILDLEKAKWDIGARKGLSESSPDWELTAGVTLKL
jgi:hypothetical protein